MRTFGYVRPADAADAAGAAAETAHGRWAAAPTCCRSSTAASARRRGRRPARRSASPASRTTATAVRIGATTSVADVERDAGIGERFAGLAQAAAAVGSPQLREMGTVGGNLCQQVRCWYFRHPDLQCWLRGGDTCYAQIGDHRKHGLEPGDCISVAPSDLAAALLALDAQVETNRPAASRWPTSTGARPPTSARRSRSSRASS